MTHLCRCSSYA